MRLLEASEGIFCLTVDHGAEAFTVDQNAGIIGVDAVFGQLSAASFTSPKLGLVIASFLPIVILTVPLEDGTCEFLRQSQLSSLCIYALLIQIIASSSRVVGTFYLRC